MPGDNNAQTKPKTVQTAVLNEPKKEVKTPVKEPVKQVEVKPNFAELYADLNARQRV